jgi:pimeloyl-ACP methyl ester carboxylesterase
VNVAVGRWLSRAIAILVTSAGMACSQIQPANVASSGRVPLTECRVEGLAEPARCGTVRVAESSAANARSLDLRVIVVPALGSAPLPDPVLPLAGGPGQGAADLALLYARRLASLREERDLVLVDQRGTGASNGLRCAPASSPIELMGRLFDAATLTACRDDLSRRADLTRYTTSGAAADYERVFDGLGYRQVNVIGTSYGSRLGLELARRFPNRVRTLTIEGVVPTWFGWPSAAAPDAEAALVALVDDCTRDRACHDAFPQFQRDVDRAFARLAKEPAHVTVRDPATGTTHRVPFGVSDLAYATRGLLYGQEALSLPEWFGEAAQGRYELFAQAYVTRARRMEEQLSLGVHLGVYCAEDVPFVDWAEATRRAAGTRIGTYLIDQYRAACEIWPRGEVPPGFREPIHSAVPTLLMSGRRDPVSPPRGADEAARTLSVSRALVWPHGGHATDGLVNPGCRTAIQREFLRTADPLRLSLACTTQEPILPFRLPAR